MNILFLSAYPVAVTGGNKRYERLIKYALSNNPKSRWLVLDRRVCSSHCEQVIRISGRLGFSYTFKAFVGCIKSTNKIRRECVDIDVIHVFGETPVLAAIYVSLLLGVPLSIGVRSNNNKLLSIRLDGKPFFLRLRLFVINWFRFLPIKLGYNLSRLVTVQSDIAKENFCRDYNFPEEKVVAIPNDLPVWASQVSERTSMRKYRARPKRLLFVGDGSDIKGFDVLVSALRLFKDMAPMIDELGVVGEIDMEPPRIPGLKVELMGRLEDLSDVMFEYDLLIVPSRDDQFPNVVLEAMATGLPVIGSNVDGIAYMLNDPFLLFEPSNAVSLLECLIRVQTEAGYSEAVSFITNRVSDFRFCWEERYIDILRQRFR